MLWMWWEQRVSRLSLHSKSRICTEALGLLTGCVAETLMFNRFMVTVTKTVPGTETVVCFLKVLCYIH